MNLKTKSITLMELLVSMVIMSMVVLSIYSIVSFSSNQIVSLGRKLKVQSDLSFALEHIGKYAQQAIGDSENPAFEYWHDQGFQMRVDFEKTPSDLDDDPKIRYKLHHGNNLQVDCHQGCSGCCAKWFPHEMVLSTKIIAGVVKDTLMPENPDKGLYVKISSSGNMIDIGLVGRYSPTQAAGSANPQVEMKTKIIGNSASAN